MSLSVSLSMCLSVGGACRLLQADEGRVQLPKGLEDYDHRVRNMVPFLDTIAGGDGGFGLDELVSLRKAGKGGIEWDDGMGVNKQDVMNEA